MAIILAGINLGVLNPQSQNIEQALQDATVKRFSGTPTIRYGVTVGVDDVSDTTMSASLDSVISVPLKGLGVDLIKQTGQPVDVKLPLLFVLVQVVCGSRDGCDVIMRTVLSRQVQLPRQRDIEFSVDVWRKDHSWRVPNASEVRAGVREFLGADMNEFGRYWAIANKPR